MEPSIGLRETIWYVDPENDTAGDDDRFNRQIYDLKLDLTSEISKIFDVTIANIDQIKHNILPEISYDYIPDQDQDDLPQFDALARIEEQNLLTYSITNLFTWRSVKKQKDSTDAPNYDYRQFGRLKFEQSYDINEARDDKADGIPDNKRRPFSPLTADLDLILGQYLTIDADAGWDVYDDTFTTANAAFTVNDERGDNFSTEYRYTKDKTESINFNIHLKVSDRFTTFAEYERNIFDNQRIDTVLGILYKSQCWSLELRYIEEPEDQTYQFSINLWKLGELGT